MEKKKAKRLLWIAVLCVVVVAICIIIPAIATAQMNITGGKEKGSYYNVDNENETLTITDDMQFSLQLDDLQTQGTYKLASCCWADYYVVLYTDENEVITTNYGSDKITMNYDGQTRYFVKI